LNQKHHLVLSPSIKYSPHAVRVATIALHS
jgi:hypothetical protein